MVKKIIGILLIIAGFILGILFASKGLMFPHLSGPAVVELTGIVLLASKQKI